MGGTGTWDLALAYPDVFSRIAPMSGSLTLSRQEIEGVEACYIYRYHPDANMLSTPKTVSGKNSYTYRQGAADSEVSYLVTTSPMTSRKYYDGTGAIPVVFPG